MLKYELGDSWAYFSLKDVSRVRYLESKALSNLPWIDGKGEIMTEETVKHGRMAVRLEGARCFLL